MSEHTPGPWAVQGARASYEVLDKDRDLLAQTWSEANARLIAAAPDLLDLVRSALRMEYCEGDVAILCYSWIKRAKAALAKAEERT